MKALKLCLCLFLFALTVGAATATDQTAISMEGSYLLIQEDRYQRILSLDRGGVALQAAAQQSVIGFTGGQGAWEQTGPDTAVVKVLDFTFTFGDGKQIGPAVIQYKLTFSGKADGRYQKVEGVFDGAQHAVGQNALTTKEQPLRTFSVRFTGQRITAN